MIKIPKKQLIELEKLEQKYLNKYFYFLKFAEDELLKGLNTMNRVKGDWFHKWNPEAESNEIVNFDIGIKRIFYSIFNGEGIGQPNSAPIGSDLFFEVDDAFIHIDLKTVQTRNIGDYNSDIFVGNNQNSYNGKLDVSGNEKKYDEASLPHYYTLSSKSKKPCLTYFITILYEEIQLEILNINILSMPNGALFPIYEKDVLKAGKIQYPKGNPKRDTHNKSVRYNWKKCQDFRLLNEGSKRIKVVYLNESMSEEFLNKLKLIKELHKNQIY